MKQFYEYVRGLVYKLWIMGIPFSGPVYIEADNYSLLVSTTIPDSTLKKKYQSIDIHMVKEGLSRDKWRTVYVNTYDNQADLLTKQLPTGEKRRGLVIGRIHHIYKK